MALIVETGAGLPDADAYVTLDEADAYHAALGNAAWAAAEVATRETAIRRATAFLDASYSWRGRLKNQAQRRRWPRVGPRTGVGVKLTSPNGPQGEPYFTERYATAALLDLDGRELLGVPRAVKEATCEAALLALAEALLTADRVSASQDSGAIKSVGAGSARVEYFGPSAAGDALTRTASGALAGGASEHLDRILRGLYVPPNGGRVRIAKA